MFFTFWGQGGVLENITNLTVRGELFWALEITCYCAVNVFAIISGYVGLNAKRKGTSIINLCMQVAFYAIVYTCVEVVVLLSTRGEITIKGILANLFPSVHSMWYFSAYFCLFFFMPILNSVIENVSKKVLQKSAIFIFLIFCCATQLTSNVSNLKAGYSVLWLAIMYLLGAYMAKYKTLSNTKIWVDFLGFIVCVIVTVISRIAMGNLFGRGINILVSYTSPTITLCAVFLVSVFSKIKTSTKLTKTVAFLSPLAFGVYLVHCHPYVFGNLSGAFAFIANMPLYYAIFVVILVALCIFIACLIIDYLRLILFKLCKVNKLSILIENAFKKITDGIVNLFDKSKT